MTTLNKTLTGIVILIVIVASFFFWREVDVTDEIPPEDITQSSIVAMYSCDEGRSITATFLEGKAVPSATPELPPTPGGRVDLSLSDGRTMTLSQTISASGVRYASQDETIVFWNKGDTAIFMENNVLTYGGCIEVAADPGELPVVYSSGKNGFSIRLPRGGVTDEAYRYQAMGPGKDIYGVKFTIPPQVAEGTNLSKDTYLGVEMIPDTTLCDAGLFLQDAIANNVEENGVEYSVASSTGAAAGNRYEEVVYALSGTNPCVSVRYFVHYGVFENYPTGAVVPFDHVALTQMFDEMRKTLIIAQ